jgi:hypothetical protein
MAGLGACGDDELDAGDVEAAKRVMTSWAEAWERHDGAGICATLTEEMRARYGTGDEGCARGLRERSRKSPIKGPIRVRLREGETGDRIAGYIFPARSALGEGEVTLVADGGDWLIDQDLTCVFPSC